MPYGQKLLSSLLVCLVCSGCGIADVGGGESHRSAQTTLGARYDLIIRSVATYRDLETSEKSILTTGIKALVSTRELASTFLLSVRPCAVTLPTAGGYHPMLPDATLAGLAPLTVTATLSSRVRERPGGQVVSTEEVLTTTPAALTIGVHLDDPLGDPMPTSSSDPRIVDSDGDDHPGVSVSVSLFKVYLALRVVLSLDGRVQDDGASLTGTAHARLDEVILGDSVPFVEVAEKVKASSAQSKLVSATTTFEMHETSATSCLDLE